MGWLEDALGYIGFGGQQQQDPYSLSSLMPAIEPSMSVGAPYDFAPSPVATAPVQPDSSFQSMLGELAKQSSAQIDGITAQNDALRKEREGLDTWAENNWGQVGSAAVGAIAAALAGGNAGDIATGGYGMGNTYYNNLEAQEKLKVLRLDKLIDSNTTSITDLRNFGQSLNTAALTNAGQIERDLKTGAYPGTPAAELVRKQKQEDADREFNLRNPMITVGDKSMRKDEWAIYNQDRRADAQEGQLTALSSQRASKLLAPTGFVWGDPTTKKEDPSYASEKRADDARDIAMSYAPAAKAAASLADAIEGKVDPSVIRANKGQLIRLLAEPALANLGAATNEKEFALKLPEILRTWETSDQPLANIFAQKMQGVDAVKILRNLEANLNSTMESKFETIGLFRPVTGPEAPKIGDFNDKRSRLRADMAKAGVR